MQGTCEPGAAGRRGRLRPHAHTYSAHIAVLDTNPGACPAFRPKRALSRSKSRASAARSDRASRSSLVAAVVRAEAVDTKAPPTPREGTSEAVSDDDAIPSGEVAGPNRWDSGSLTLRWERWGATRAPTEAALALHASSLADANALLHRPLPTPASREPSKMADSVRASGGTDAAARARPS